MDSREQLLWVFRHIGPPPSIPEGVEVVELKEGATTFGRGATADVYIDSLVLRNFISRRHAVVIGKKNQDGHLQFILHNHGLNGTYVNDVRIGEVHQLQEGDRVTFGHKNGYKVKIGETAQQPDSEFQFVLEQCQPAKLGKPLQEHKQQVGTKSGTHLSDTDQSKTASICNQNGLAITDDISQQHSNSTNRRKGSDQQNSCDDLPKSSSKTPETHVSRMPRTHDADGMGTKSRLFRGKGSPREREKCATKENKGSKLNTALQDIDEVTCPHRRHSDDGVPKSFWCKSKQDPARRLSLSADEVSSAKPIRSSASFSPKHSSPHVSKSPKENYRTASVHADILSKSPKCKEKSRSPKQVNRSRRSSFENSESAKCALPIRNASAESRSVSPRHVSSACRSLPPKPEQFASKSPDRKSIKSTSRSPTPVLSDQESDLPRRLSTRSRSPSEGNRRSSSVYDEPPVLTPEYVKTPSSEIRTPSPDVYLGKDEENFHEVDDIDSVFCGIPLTPGHSFLDLSPGSHSRKYGASPQYKKDVSLHNRGEEVSSSGPDPDVGGYVGNQKGKGKNNNSFSAPRHESTPFDKQRNRSLGKEERCSNSEKRNENCNKKQQYNLSSKPKVSHTEPDSTTTLRDKDCDSDSDAKRKVQRNNEKDCPKYKSSQHFKTRHNKDHVNTSTDILAQKQYRSQVKDQIKNLPFPTKTIDRNVFKDFLTAEVDRSPERPKRKRHHSVELDSCGDDSSKVPPKAVKLHQNRVEKENGLNPGRKSSVKGARHNGKSGVKQLTDGLLLKDVKVSIQRVGSRGKGPTTPSETMTRNRKWTQKAGSTVEKSGATDKIKKNSSITARSKPEKKEVTERKDSSDTSLFGMEMERLGMMRLKERTRTLKEKTGHPKGEKSGPSAARTPRERSKRSEKSATHRPHDIQKSSASERSKERRIVKSRSSTPDKFWTDDETDRARPVRKVAMRRPRQSRNNVDNTVQQKDSEKDERRVSRPARKRKRRRKKKHSDDDDEEEEDESLEEGVTWYEEDTCASDHCCRPADRRVQWVCCDDCDSWYHTVCVGIFLEDLKEDEDYHCGCV